MRNDKPLVPPNITEPSEDTVIWRYINFEKYSNLLVDKKIILSSPSKFNDKYEGAYTNSNIYEAIKRILESDASSGEMEISNLCHLHEDAYPFKKSIFITCWHVANNETMHMWQSYAGLYEGIAIQSTYGRLKDVLNDKFFIGLVKYYNNETLPNNQIFRHFYKLKHYEHENEVRAIYYSQEDFLNHIHNNTTAENKTQWHYEIDPSMLIERIIISPSADSNFQARVIKLASSCGIPVEQSNLSRAPNKLRTLLENIKCLLQLYAQPNCPHCNGVGFIIKRSPFAGKFCQSCNIASNWEHIKQALKNIKN